jgi:hypothetical protein
MDKTESMSKFLNDLSPTFVNDGSDFEAIATNLHEAVATNLHEAVNLFILEEAAEANLIPWSTVEDKLPQLNPKDIADIESHSNPTGFLRFMPIKGDQVPKAFSITGNPKHRFGIRASLDLVPMEENAVN